MSASTSYSNNTSLFKDSAKVTLIDPSGSRIFDVDAINLDDTLTSYRDISLIVSRTYLSHPPSFIVGALLVSGNLLNFGFFISWGAYLLHPILSFGLFICGIGILSTMYLANK